MNMKLGYHRYDDLAGATEMICFWKFNFDTPAKLYRSRPEVFCKKSVLKNFTKFTGKHLCLSLFLTKLQASGRQL